MRNLGCSGLRFSGFLGIIVLALVLAGCSGDDGDDGNDGSPGADGINFWDLNENGVADPEEDLNGDGVVDDLDKALDLPRAPELTYGLTAIYEVDVGDYGYVMEVGRIVMEDTTERLSQATDIQEFYLGLKDEGVRGRRRWKQRKTWR